MSAVPELRLFRVRGARDADLPLPAPRHGGQRGARSVRRDRVASSCSRPASARVVPTGFALAIPPGYEGQVRPRSGLALRHGVTIANAPGTIDSDYRGELGVILRERGRASRSRCAAASGSRSS